MVEALLLKSPQTGLSGEQVDNLLRQVVSGGGALILRQRDDAMVARVKLPGGGSVIAKLWTRTGVTGFLRQISRTGPAAKEWKAMRRLHEFRVAVPEPLAYFRLRSKALPYSEALLMEDLGDCEMAVDFIKRPLRAGDEERVREFENDLIALTGGILRAGIVDSDHGMVNVVVPASGKPYRLDLELARRVASPQLAPAAFGTMIGRLIGGYAFAVQPDVARVPIFARRLINSLKIPPSTVERAKQFMTQMLESQRKNDGIDTQVSMDWSAGI